jgi:hypothetical protein
MCSGPLNCRGGCYFWLDPKVTKRSSRKNRSAAQAFALGPGFPVGLYDILQSLGLDIVPMWIVSI